MAPVHNCAVQLQQIQSLCLTVCDPCPGAKLLITAAAPRPSEQMCSNNIHSLLLTTISTESNHRHPAAVHGWLIHTIEEYGNLFVYLFHILGIKCNFCPLVHNYTALVAHLAELLHQTCNFSNWGYFCPSSVSRSHTSQPYCPASSIKGQTKLAGILMWVGHWVKLVNSFVTQVYQ